MIIAHHLIWTAYGWWLPNDPRGSSSHIIRSDVIAELGQLQATRKKIQPASGAIRTFYAEASGRLQHKLLLFSTDKISALAESFAGTIARCRYTCWACAIMPDHVHMVIRKHRHDGDKMIRQLQNDSRLFLREAGLCSPDHPVWGGPGWKVYLDTPYDVRRSVEYVQNNPARQGLPALAWPFVIPYNNWPFQAGSSPNSPYARAAKGEKPHIAKSQADGKSRSDQESS